MNQNLFSRTEAYLKDIQANEETKLFEYFDTSTDFNFYGEKGGLEIPFNTTNGVYVDGEMDDRNKYKEYIAFDRSFIIRVDIYGIRQGIHLWSSNSSLSLEKLENLESDVPIYRVTCK